MVKHGYTFDPATMYQPDPLVTDSVLLWGGPAVLHRDGSVTSNENWPVEHVVAKKYNQYEIGCGTFKAYQESGKLLWPRYPSDLKAIDHINRDSHNDRWSNLRRINTSLNNINRNTKALGWFLEDRTWLSKTNAARVKKGQTPLSMQPRDKYISRVFYKGRLVELGVHETPEQAHENYINGREKFIQDTLRTIWCEFLFQ